MIDDHHPELAEAVGTRRACQLLGRARATHYRRRRAPRCGPPSPRPAPPNALSPSERTAVLELLHRPYHCDLAVAQVWGRTLDDGTYLCSQSTMHRLLRGNGESKERRRQRTHPAKKKPELMATQPNQVWSWDITKLRGPNRGEYYDLYVILDIFSRYVVGWLLAPTESAELATDFIHDAVLTQGVDRDQLTIHADRGSSMRSKPVSQLMVDLGVARSHSRPHVSNDNPYSEAAFKTLKYCPAFPDRFGSIEDARAFCQRFFPWYNHQHHHSGIALLTPDMLHYGTASQIIEQRQNVLDQAYVRNPERFVRANSYQFKSFHHDVLALPNGHWVLLACYNKQYSNFGGVADNADALGDALVDVDENGNPDWVWNTFDHWTSIVIQ